MAKCDLLWAHALVRFYVGVVVTLLDTLKTSTSPALPSETSGSKFRLSQRNGSKEYNPLPESSDLPQTLQGRADGSSHKPRAVLRLLPSADACEAGCVCALPLAWST